VDKLKKPLVVLMVVFIIYAVINDPNQAAKVTGNAWDYVKGGVASVTTFFDELLKS